MDIYLEKEDQVKQDLGKRIKRNLTGPSTRETI
jgi:hypothetical protein